MTTLRSPHRLGAAITATGLLAAAALMLTGAPAAADPSPQPSPPANAGVPKPAPGSITWSVQASSAQGPDGRRSFSYDKLKPGTVVRDYVSVTNFSVMPVTFNLYATDAFNDASGTLTLLPAAQKPTDIGSWVSQLKNSITLKPNERANEPFTLTIPSTATPGDHAGGIIASVIVEGKNNQGATVKVDRRLGIPLNLRVDGPLTPGLKIESVSSVYHGTVNPVHGGGVDVNYTVHNTGNIRLNLTQDIAAKGLFGLAKLRGIDAKPLTDLLPGASYHAKVHLNNVFPLGPIDVHVHAVPKQVADARPLSAKLQDQSFSVSMWATPWLVIVVLVLLIAGFFVGWWRMRSRRTSSEQVLADVMEAASRQTVEALRKKATAARTKVAASSGGSGTGGSGASGSGKSGSAKDGGGSDAGGTGGGASSG